MAKLVTETVILTVNRLVKDSDVDTEIVTPDILELIEQTTSEIMGGHNAIIEVIKA